MRRLHPLQRACLLGFRRAQARARQQFRVAAHEWEAELALLQADLTDTAVDYRHHLDVELAVIERAASPDMLLHARSRASSLSDVKKCGGGGHRKISHDRQFPTARALEIMHTHKNFPAANFFPKRWSVHHSCGACLRVENGAE